MTHNWRNGDVAIINGNIGIYDGDGFRRPGLPFCNANSINGRGARPLLVIDPENREQIERLTEAFEAFGAASSPTLTWDDQMQAALRSLLEPEPEEPTLAGALVIDAEGADWHRTRTGRWISDDGLRSRSCGWPGLPRPITVLSEGWQESTDE